MKTNVELKLADGIGRLVFSAEATARAGHKNDIQGLWAYFCTRVFKIRCGSLLPGLRSASPIEAEFSLDQVHDLVAPLQ